VKRFRIATYNVHKCQGLDRRVSPARIAAVLDEIDADIVAVQEILLPQAEAVARDLGYRFELGETRKHAGHAYGNVTFSRRKIERVMHIDLTVAGREARGCLRTDIPLAGRLLHVFNLHLGTAYGERRAQAQLLREKELLRAWNITGARVVLGDFNEWVEGLVTRTLRAEFAATDLRPHLPRRRMYPVALPLLQLDHIYFDPHLEAERAWFHVNARTLVASDHLPLVAEFRFRGK
jgi:endonuclease/exonuclease/phosphatase family metal-dependent hydrolase